MTITEPAAEVDPDKVMQFVFRAVDEAGATLNAALVVLGDKLGYYRVLAAEGATTAAELAERSGTALPAEHAVALTIEDSPAFLPGLFQIALGTVTDTAVLTLSPPRSDR